MSTGTANATPTASTLVDTKQVAGRRTLRFNDYDELLAELEGLRSKQLSTVGNWSAGQIFDHLAKSTHEMIDGGSFLLPAPVRWVMSFFMKKKFLTVEIPAGFKIPKAATGVLPQDVDADEGLQRLMEAIRRAKNEPTRAMHPGFGKLSRQEWDQFHLRHSELHLSFVKPV